MRGYTVHVVGSEFPNVPKIPYRGEDYEVQNLWKISKDRQKKALLGSQ